MWRENHTALRPGVAGKSGSRRPRIGLLAVLFLVGGVGVGSHAAAQPVPAPRPDESHARAAHRLVEAWVRRGGVPGDRAAAIRVTGAVGVRVTLRLDGVTLGTGTAVRPDLDALLKIEGPGQENEANERGVNLIDLMEIATDSAIGHAMQTVKERQLEQRIAAHRDPDQTAPLDEISPADMGRQVDVDVQIAHSPRRIVIGDQESADAIYARFAPGHHGLLGVADGVDEAGLVWPATALAGNLPPDRQVLRLLVSVRLKPDQAEVLGRPGGVALYRFEALHIVRSRPDQPVLVLTRGGRLLPARFVDEKTLADISDRVGSHLYGRFIGNGRVRGSYQPARGTYHPELADDREVALASYALVRYAERQRLDRKEEQVFVGHDLLAGEATEGVVGRMLAADARPDPVAAGFCLMTILRAPAGTFDPALRPRVAELLRRMIDDEGRLVADPHEPEAALPAASTAVALAALIELYDQTREPELGRQVVAVLDRLWTDHGGRFDVNTSPWIARAHVRSSPLLLASGLIDEATLASRSVDLKWMFDRVAESQVVARPGLGPADVVGGVVVRRGPDGSPPNPTWQTAPLFSFVATVLRDPRVAPPAGRFGMLVTAQSAARFLGQLMIDQPGCFAIRSPAEALGGIRLSLWDNRLDVAPSALTLLALLEMRETFAYLQQQEAAAEAEEAAPAEPTSTPVEAVE